MISSSANNYFLAAVKIAYNQRNPVEKRRAGARQLCIEFAKLGDAK